MVSHVTHLICGNNYNEEDINEATELYEVPAVGEEWVKASVRLGKFAIKKPYHPLPNRLFSNRTFAIINVSQRDRKILFGLIAYHGGKIQNNLDSNVNILICGAPHGAAYSKAFKLGVNKIIIVTPDWVTKCIKSKTLIGHSTFHPRLLVIPKAVATPNLNRLIISEQKTGHLKTIIGFETIETDNSQTKEKIYKEKQTPPKSEIIQQQTALPQVIVTSMPSSSTSIKMVPQHQQGPQQNVVRHPLHQYQQQPLQQHQQQQIQFRPQFQQLNQQNKAILQQQNIQIQKTDNLTAINPNLMHQRQHIESEPSTQTHVQQQHQQITQPNQAPQQQIIQQGVAPQQQQQNIQQGQVPQQHTQLQQQPSQIIIQQQLQQQQTILHQQQGIQLGHQQPPVQQSQGPQQSIQHIQSGNAQQQNVQHQGLHQQQQQQTQQQGVHHQQQQNMPTQSGLQPQQQQGNQQQIQNVQQQNVQLQGLAPQQQIIQQQQGHQQQQILQQQSIQQQVGNQQQGNLQPTIQQGNQQQGNIQQSIQQGNQQQGNIQQPIQQGNQQQSNTQQNNQTQQGNQQQIIQQQHIIQHQQNIQQQQVLSQQVLSQQQVHPQQGHQQNQQLQHVQQHQQIIQQENPQPIMQKFIVTSTSADGQQQSAILSQQQKQQIIQNIMINQQNQQLVAKQGNVTAGGQTKIQIIQTKAPQQMKPGSTMIIHQNQPNMQQKIITQQPQTPHKHQIILNQNMQQQGGGNQQNQQIFLINSNLSNSGGSVLQLSNNMQQNANFIPNQSGTVNEQKVILQQNIPPQQQHMDVQQQQIQQQMHQHQIQDQQQMAQQSPQQQQQSQSQPQQQQQMQQTGLSPQQQRLQYIHNLQHQQQQQQHQIGQQQQQQVGQQQQHIFQQQSPQQQPQQAQQQQQNIQQMNFQIQHQHQQQQLQKIVTHQIPDGNQQLIPVQQIQVQQQHQQQQQQPPPYQINQQAQHPGQQPISSSSTQALKSPQQQQMQIIQMQQQQIPLQQQQQQSLQQSPQQWTPQSPVHGPQQQQVQTQIIQQPPTGPGAEIQHSQQIIQQQVVQQQGMQQNVQQGNLPSGQHFIRGPRPGWSPQAPQRKVVQLDAQNYNQLQAMNPIQRAEYLLQLQNKQQIQVRQRIAYQTRPGVPVQNIVSGARPGTQHIVIRPQMPPNLTPQQQVQWLQQQGARPILVRPNTTPGLSPISQQALPTPVPQFTVDPNLSPQQQQQQLLIQRQQFHRLQQIQIQRDQAAKAAAAQQQNQAVSPRSFNRDAPDIVAQSMTPAPQSVTPQPVTPVSNIPTTPVNVTPQSQIAVHDASNAAQNQMNSKTKTALANMLSSRLSNNGPPQHVEPQISVPPSPEPSAAGTLRLMTQQHNASLNPQVARPPQELANIQHQQNQRRTLGNITNNTSQVINQIPQSSGGALIVQQQQQPPPGTPIIKGTPFSPNRLPVQRSQYYGHNPNLKLPSELFLLGCNFYIVEYDETHPKELPDWKEIIRKHGGEIENSYCAKVTHVLCCTQRHGVVMQAIRDSKRCVTAHWLNDTILKKQVCPPWQAHHLPTPATFGIQKPATRHIIAITGFEGEERVKLKIMVEESGAILTDYFSKHNTVLICKNLEGPKYKHARECNIPAVNATWLSDILLGNLSAMSQYEQAKYQQFNPTGSLRIDYSLVAHLMSEYLTFLTYIQIFFFFNKFN